ncbi:OsmC family peroxiredoxin [Amycolatopsis sp. NPDC005961]|uniref:OsmC family peroxiredoxin n=1 Tax=Amycolatopsis sp. NPDC005961 TaxID=3156720 RepID=UPI0033D5B3FD
MIASATASWQGTFHQGDGTISTSSTTLRNHPYTFASRFEGAEGGNPEELLAAAHAACYNHTVANILLKRELPAGFLTTIAQVDMGSDAVTPGIRGVHLIVHAVLPGVTAEQFQEIAERALRTCAISKALSVPVTLDSVLEN